MRIVNNVSMLMRAYAYSSHTHCASEGQVKGRRETVPMGRRKPMKGKESKNRHNACLKYVYAYDICHKRQLNMIVDKTHTESRRERERERESGVLAETEETAD